MANFSKHQQLIYDVFDSLLDDQMNQTPRTAEQLKKTETQSIILSKYTFLVSITEENFYIFLRILKILPFIKMKKIEDDKLSFFNLDDKNFIVPHLISIDLKNKRYNTHYSLVSKNFENDTIIKHFLDFNICMPIERLYLEK